jgi:hypothetical protein
MGLGRVACSTHARFRALPVLLLFAVHAAPGLAAAPPSRVPHYETPAECPARHAWLERLHAKLPASSAARQSADELSVRIERRAGGVAAGDYHGTVSADGAEKGRTVEGTSCAEVFEALVLVALLSLETVAEHDASRSGKTLTSNDASAASAEPIELVDGPPVGEDHQRGDRLRWGAVGLVLVQSGIAPRPSVDLGAGLAVRWSSSGEPWLMLGVYTGSHAQTVQVEGASARFEHAALRAVGCPWRYPSARWLALRPCLGLDVGRCRGEGSGVSGASSNSTLWLAARGELRLEFSIYDGLSLGGAGGAALPFVRPRFYFEPGAIAFQVPALGVEAGAFAAWLF